MRVSMWLSTVTKIFMFQTLPHQPNYSDCTTDLPVFEEKKKKANEVVIGPPELSDPPLNQSAVSRGGTFCGHCATDWGSWMGWEGSPSGELGR